MAGWHSLSGYLHYKSGGALGRLIAKKKVWCVLEDSQCQLLYFKSEEEKCSGKAAYGHLDIKGAAIYLDNENPNQFVIGVHGKEHFFTAENHESMMIWLLGLQAKRDMHCKKINTVENMNASELDARNNNKFDLTAFWARPNISMDQSNISFSGSMNLPTFGKPQSFSWEKYTAKNYGESVDTGIKQLKSLESSKSLPIEVEGTGIQRDRLLDSKWLSESAVALHSNYSSPDSDEAFGKDSVQLRRKSSRQRLRKMNSLDIELDSHVRNGQHFDQADNGNRSSSMSGSSDSAIDRDETTLPEMSLRLTELEKELISAKCSLAQVLNQQTYYQELLQKRDDTIRVLEEKFEGSPGEKAVGDKTTNKHHGKSPNVHHNDKEFQEKIRVLQNQNRFLNGEVKKLAKIRLLEHGKYEEQNQRLLYLEAEIEKWKLDYVSVIQSSIHYPGGDGIEDMELCLYGEDRHKKRIQHMLQEARKTNPSLPTFESLAMSEVHVDKYGFKHKYTNTGLLLHYLCTELTHHYLMQVGTYEEHQKRWTVFMKQHSRDPMKMHKELKALCRAGIPDRFRTQIWCQLVHHKVKDIMEEKGPHYFRNLCNSLPESPLAACYRKQISLDLMRTIPSNIRFSTQGSKGIMDLQDVLLAFSIHNPSVGYCQGMNFIVGMALLFMDAQDAFWTLVAVTERYFSAHYFNHSLIGAQADQQVLKDMVRNKLPSLWHHLENIDIELATITLNWFLAVFFDAVPFQTLLRIWDCFLLEGPKVLFRFSLAIMKLNEKEILQRTDTISVMKYLKACAKLTFDVDGLVKLAFEGLKPLPGRRSITSKQACYLNALKEKHKKKELQRLAFAEREHMYLSMEAESGSFLGIECAVVLEEGRVWVCYGHQHVGKVSEVHCRESTMNDLEIELDSRVMCIAAITKDSVVLGTISWMLIAIDTKTRAILWQLRLHDAVLSVCCYKDDDTMVTRIFAGLADGTIAIIEHVKKPVDPKVEAMYILIGQAPVMCLMLLDDQLWVASGNMVSIIHARTLDTMDTFSVSVNPYDHILSLVQGVYGIWISLRGSSILELWDPKSLHCKMLYDTRTDRYPHLRKEDDTYFNRARITSILANDDCVWVGTGEGNLIVYEVIEMVQTRTPTDPSSSHDTSSNHSYFLHQKRSKENYSKEIEQKVNELYQRKLQKGGRKLCPFYVGDTGLRCDKDARNTLKRESDMSNSVTPVSCSDQEFSTPRGVSPCQYRNFVLDDDCSGKEEMAEFEVNDKIKCHKRNKYSPANELHCELDNEHIIHTTLCDCRPTENDVENSQSERKTQLLTDVFGRNGFVVKDLENNLPGNYFGDITYSSQQNVDTNKNIFDRQINRECSLENEFVLSKSTTTRSQSSNDRVVGAEHFDKIMVAEMLNVGMSNEMNDVGHTDDNKKLSVTEEMLQSKDTDGLEDVGHLCRINDRSLRGEMSNLDRVDIWLSSLPKNDGKEISEEIAGNGNKPKFHSCMDEPNDQEIFYSVENASLKEEVKMDVSNSQSAHFDSDSDVLDHPAAVPFDAGGRSEQLTRHESDGTLSRTSDKDVGKSGKEIKINQPKTLPIGKSWKLQPMKNESFGSNASQADASTGSFESQQVKVAGSKDQGIQYRLEFSGVHVETDSSDLSSNKLKNENVIFSFGNPLFTDSRHNSVDFSRTSSFDLFDTNGNTNSVDHQILEFLRTPSIASRQMNLGLKIIEDDLEWNELYAGRCSSQTTPTSSADQLFADFLKTPSLSSRQNSLWSSYENISTPSQKELAFGNANERFLQPKLAFGHLSHSPSSASFVSNIEMIYSVDLRIEAKVKISDKPVRCLLLTSLSNEPIVFSFSGCYGDDEAVLKWQRKPNELLWTNEPVLEICTKTNDVKLPMYMCHRKPSCISQKSQGSGDSGLHSIVSQN
ncbi:hypothetical protein CHS0354_008131 [Potamilus streckersoni]|uniref:TBC1 domain family member 2B n=1 Tax=Potamilus streckersoni TaxID=2493646 RepID=A0AAE0W4B9_9BIVA|nr:hypothetical protein CHS0354_008131 [Potamilus streckersoni]